MAKINMIYSTFSADVAPCYECDKRHSHCHVDCELYKAWKADCEKKHEHERQENLYIDYRREQNTAYAGSLWKGDRAYKRHFKGKAIRK